MSRIAIFFGAGAELSYGLPSGGKFALDIFKMDVGEDKRKFREIRSNIKKKSIYAKNWLPQDYENKPISSFGRRQYESLVKSSLEYRKNEILNYFSEFDRNVGRLCDKFKANHSVDIKNLFNSILEVQFGEELFTHEIRISKLLGDYNQLFSSKFFSSYLKVLELQSCNPIFKKNCKNFCRAILELLIGACGEGLIQKINDGVFEKRPDEIDIFDDIGGIFSIDYCNAGLSGLELILDNNHQPSDNKEDIVYSFALEILEDIFATSLDYQSLIDSNWRYLYSPKTDWAKFCKINIFLYTAHRYISGMADEYKEKITGEESDGYYHDIIKLKEKYDISVIGTTNYNTFIEKIIGEDIYYLNGSVSDYYDPYLNTITKDESDHFTVPFLFTQSGIKPLTSIKISQRYVEFYEQLKKSDIVVVIGYAFNIDDGHINGLFRSYIEDEKKSLTVFHYTEDLNSKFDLEDHYQEKLRLINTENLKIIKINNERKTVNNEYWYNAF